MNRFKGQIAIIAGGARGIGRGIAMRIALEGGEVIIFDVLEQEIDKTVRGAQKGGLPLRGVCVDITNEDAVKDATEAVVAQSGKIDILVNCAGIVGPTAVHIMEYSSNEFDQVLQVNLKGAFLLTKYALPSMVKHTYGRILHISSIGGKEGNPGMVGYAASKAGLMGLVKGVGKEYAERGITVNGMAPAVIATEMNADTAPAMLKYMTDKIPMKRRGSIEEVAALSCWIVSKEASFNTGVIFDLSGGRATF